MYVHGFAYVHVHMCTKKPVRSEEGVQPPVTVVTGYLNLPLACWKSNPGPMQSSKYSIVEPSVSSNAINSSL